MEREREIIVINKIQDRYNTQRTFIQIIASIVRGKRFQKTAIIDG